MDKNQTGIHEDGVDYLLMKRVVYGKKDTSVEKREYRGFVGGPVGTRKDIYELLGVEYREPLERRGWLK